jgi:hypothetical protein
MGGWAGFSVGWLYWYFWVIVVGFEAVAGAKVITYWLPGLPLWLLSLVLMLLMTATNLFSVKSFGEFEFWFAGIKVGAIVLFLVFGAAFALGLWPGKSADFSNLVAHGGFFPNGVGAIFSAIVVVIFSMVGAEIATIAAAESEDPRAGDRQGDALGHPAHPGVLRGCRLPPRGHRPVGPERVGHVAVRPGLRPDGDPVRRPPDERGGAHRRAVVPELGAVHGVADAVRAGGPP